MPAFTPAQQAAIDHDGHLLIVAGPGSGKTATSVAKAQRILSYPKRSLLMVTFTKEGTDEMRRRIDKAQADAGQPPFDKARLRIGTFHSIALQHLFMHRRRERLLSPAQQGILLNDAMLPYSADPATAKELREMFEFYMYSINRESVALTKEARDVVNRYMERLTASKSVDLYYIMRECALAAHHGDIPPLPFTDLIVDEGQDTDELQKVWIYAHARAGTNTTIVGDDDQSIYEWRHALGYAGMKDFLDTFNARRIELADNFRSRSEILGHAVQLVSLNKARLRKTLVARRGPGGYITAYCTSSLDRECEELAHLIKENPEIHQNAAILARQNMSLNSMEAALTSVQVPYVRIGRSIWDDQAVVTYLSLLQGLLEGSSVGIFGTLALIGLDDQCKTELLRKMDGSATEFMEGEIPDLDHATPEDRKILTDFSESCNYWRAQIRKGSLTEVLMDVGEYSAALYGKKKRPQSAVLLAASILGRLKGSLANRLKFVTQNRREGEAAVTLMTMHGSKGLEYETVHIIDAKRPEDLSDLTNAEPERRLMYVAFTRAKDRCVAWYHDKPHPTLSEAKLTVLTAYKQLERELTAA